MSRKWELRSDGERSVIVPEGTGWYDFPRFLAHTEASSWLQAKASFGFELTDLQSRMVAGTATLYEITGRTYGFADLSSMVTLPEEKRGKWKRKKETEEAGEAARRLWKSGWKGANHECVTD